MSYIKIDKAKCKSCYLCVDICPKKMIKKSNEIGKSGEFIAEFDNSKSECIGCALCAMVCPDAAIIEVYK